MEKKKSFVFYEDWWNVISNLSEEERLDAFQAIMRYAFDGEIPDDKYINAVTALMRTAIDRDNGKYAEVCRKRKEAISKRWQQRNIQMNTTDTTDTNHTDNVDVDVDENVDEKDIKKEKTSKEVKKKESSNRRFVPPTIDEVRAYCADRGNCVNAEAFCAFYESKGWMVGKNKMKDWKAAVRTWENNDGRTRTSSGVSLGVDERIENGIRTYGSGRAVIPMDAPPRPSAEYCWNESGKNWIVL